MQIEVLRLHVNTVRGVYGRTLEFEKGLTILHGPNSHGKSTALMSILYALGLEGMLSARRAIPLPHALTDYLLDGEERVDVESSSVAVQINNGRETICVRRAIKGEDDPRLIRTWQMAMTDKLSDSESVDFFVRDPGSATHDAGFHRYLTEFLGWKLPTVPRYDGKESPLYLETIFPLLFLEQKRGWLGIQARIPTHLRIRDPQIRAVEFLLGLQNDDSVLQRARCETQIQHKLEEWTHLRAVVLTLAEQAGGQIFGLPETSKSQWDRTQRPTLKIASGDEWLSVSDMAQQLRKGLVAIENSKVPTVGALADEHGRELVQVEAELERLDIAQSSFREELLLAETELVAMRERLERLASDIVRNRDAAKLRTLGSASRLALVKDMCATCGQSISGNISLGDETTPMSVEENLNFLRDMEKAVSAAAAAAERRVKTSKIKLSSLREKRSEKRQQIRALKAALVQRSSEPSEAVISKRIQLRRQLEILGRGDEKLSEVLGRLEGVHIEISTLRAQLSHHTRQEHSGEDSAKVTALQDSFKSQLSEYGVQSVEVDKIAISKTDYRPMAEGMTDLEFELSGSDLIRSIWAYFLALLEVGRTKPTNHPGFLIIDEPKQQGTEQTSIAKMLKRASDAGQWGQQIIVASGGSVEQLDSELEGIPYQTRSIDSHMLIPELPRSE